MSDYETIDVARDDQNVVTVTIERPDKLNALNETVLTELHAAADDLADDEDLRMVVFQGEGRAFIAGADIAAMLDMSPEEAEEFGALGHRTLEAIEQLPVPTLAAVDGFALGGGLEVALACDLIYASGRAAFGLPEVSLGIIPGFGGTQRLGRRVGWQRAREMVFTGQRIDAEKAESIGLCLEVFEADSFDERLAEVVDAIGSRGPLAIRAAKTAMRTGQESHLTDGLEAEQQAFADLFETEDRREGMEAFLDRREPDFDAR
jgi:enoyl-CoA hydratase